MRYLIVPPRGFCAPFVLRGLDPKPEEWLGCELPAGTLCLLWPSDNGARAAALDYVETLRNTNATQPEDNDP